MGHYMNPNSVERMFGQVCYNTKTTEQLRAAMNEKLQELRGKISEREKRMTRIRGEYKIDAERFAVLVVQFRDPDDVVSYESQRQKDGETQVPAGVIANLIRERELIDSEEEQLDKLELILRNLRETEQFAVTGTGEVKTRPCEHRLTDYELEYLRF